MTRKKMKMMELTRMKEKTWQTKLLIRSLTLKPRQEAERKRIRLMGRNARSETRISSRQMVDIGRSTEAEAVDAVEEEVDMDTSTSIEVAITVETRGGMETT